MPTGPLCGGCPQQPFGERWVDADGSGAEGILFIGDSPWKEEMLRGRNFSGPAGHLYEKWLEWLGVPREGVTTTNSMWCKPKRLGWTDHPERFPDAYAALHHCRPYLDNLIATRKPRIIVPMGNVALGRACGLTGIERFQGYVHDSVWGIPTVPTFHPSYVMQGKQKLSPVIIAALRRAKAIADGTYQPSKFTLLLDPPLDELLSYLGKFPHDLPEITVDIETPESADIDEDDVDLDLDAEEVEEDGGNPRDSSFHIIRAGFCLEEGVAVSFPFEAPYIGVLRDLLARSAIAWEWSNRHFDSIRLTAAGLPARRWASAMWAWHFWQSDLPKALGFVAPLFYNGPPWKHKAQEQPAWYNAMDNVIQDACLRGTRAKLLEEGRWSWFMRHCVETDEILVRMCKPGFLVDRDAQHGFATRIEAERDASVALLDTQVPTAVKKVKRWKREPKDLTGVVVEPTGEFQKNGKPICNYSRVELFNPNSTQQVAALIKALNLPVPMNRKEGRETTEAKHLKKLIGRAPVFRTLLDCREKNKMLSTYIWDIAPEGQVYTHYGFNPSTWRKSSYQINSQNIPKRSDLAQEFRKMIVARPGHVWMTFDAAAIEAVLVGYFAGSERYIRLAKAGVHGWLVSCKIGQPIPLDLPFEELQQRCRATKKSQPVLYEMCKRVVHLSNYKGTPERMIEEYPEYFSTKKEAADLQGLYFETEPGKDVVKWQNATLTLAHKEHLLKIPFGYWHYFYNVFAWDRVYKKWRLGDDAKRCIAFRAQATASAIQTEVLLWVRDQHPWMLPYLRLIIHDEIVLEVPDGEVDRVAPAIYAGMEQPLAPLGHLTIGCEGKVGRNLADRSATNTGGLTVLERKPLEVVV